MHESEYHQRSRFNNCLGPQFYQLWIKGTAGMQTQKIKIDRLLTTTWNLHHFTINLGILGMNVEWWWQHPPCGCGCNPMERGSLCSGETILPGCSTSCTTLFIVVGASSHHKNPGYFSPMGTPYSGFAHCHQQGASTFLDMQSYGIGV